MSTTPYHGTLFLQKVQGRLFLTVSIWWASLEPGDVLIGRVISARASKAPLRISHHLSREYHITKKSRLTPVREQREMELDTLYVRDQDVVDFAIWRDETLLAAHYQIDATHVTCIPYQDEAEKGQDSRQEQQIAFTIKSHVIDQPYRGILLFDQRAARDYGYYGPGNKTVITLTIYLWWETLYRGDVVAIQPSDHSWSKSTKTSFLDGGREQGMVEVETYAIEVDREPTSCATRSSLS